jgi:hypothetical protein
MCLDTIEQTETAPIICPPTMPDDAADRIKVVLGSAGTFTSPALRTTLHCGKPLEAACAMLPSEQEPAKTYMSGWHVVNSIEEGRTLASTLSWTGVSAIPVKCWGLVAKGKQNGIPVEVYKMMQIPDLKPEQITNLGLAGPAPEEEDEDEWGEDEDDDWPEEEDEEWDAKP